MTLGIAAAALLLGGCLSKAAAERRTDPYSRAVTINDLSLTLLPIPAGTFVWGSPEDEPGHYQNESPQTRVVIDYPFWIGRVEVTQGQWSALMHTSVVGQARLMLADDTPYLLHGEMQTVRQRTGYRKDSDPAEAVGVVAADMPMYWVNWNEAAEFCRRLTARERAAGRVPPGYVYRLPTEAEWEYAARAGTTGATYAGPLAILGKYDAPGLDAIAWYGGNSSVGYSGKGWSTADWPEKQYPGGMAGPHKVGTKKPNPWGLYNMLGNVNEWVYDWLAPLPGGQASDPAGPATGTEKVIKGGSWFNAARSSRAANRDRSDPRRRFFGLGFRVALAPEAVVAH